jgi:multicomponent Na+:H+ antiporter subunit E
LLARLFVCLRAERSISRAPLEPMPGVLMAKSVASQALLQRAVLGAVGLFVTWAGFVGSFDGVELSIGAVLAFGITVLLLPQLELLDGVRVRASLPLHLVRYFLRFGRALVHANLDVARRVAAPGRLRIRPAMVHVHTDLKSDLGRLWLANSITLTPGTLSVDLEGDTLLVHWIDADPNVDLFAATRAIAADFEDVLQEIVT